MENSYDKEIAALLADEIGDNTVLLTPDYLRYANDMESNYPFGFSGIDWAGKGFLFFIDLKEVKPMQKDEAIYEFLNKIACNFPELLNENVVVIGDNLTDRGYEMAFGLFIKHHVVFFDIPQHTYVWFTFSKKCINKTFEDEIYFG